MHWHRVLQPSHSLYEDTDLSPLPTREGFYSCMRRCGCRINSINGWSIPTVRVWGYSKEALQNESRTGRSYNSIENESSDKWQTQSVDSMKSEIRANVAPASVLCGACPLFSIYSGTRLGILDIMR